MNEAYNKSKQIIKKHIKDLHKLAKGLLEYETLTGDEIKDVLKGKKIRKEFSKSSQKESTIRSYVPNSKKRKKTTSILPEPQFDNN